MTSDRRYMGAGPYVKCDQCDSPMKFDHRSLATHIAEAHPNCLVSPTGEHEWRQYMEIDNLGRRWAVRQPPRMNGVSWPSGEFGLAPDGFFCKWCPAKADENRVVTNPEAL